MATAAAFHWAKKSPPKRAWCPFQTGSELVRHAGLPVRRQFRQRDLAAEQVREVGAEVALVRQVLAVDLEHPAVGLVGDTGVDQRVSRQFNSAGEP